MGEAGNKPRKFRIRISKVPKGAEANAVHLAGLADSGGGGTNANRLDHQAAHGRSQNVGRFGQSVLRLLGRYQKKS